MKAASASNTNEHTSALSEKIRTVDTFVKASNITENY